MLTVVGGVGNALFRENQVGGEGNRHWFKSMGNPHSENDYARRNVGDLAIQLTAVQDDSATYQNTMGDC